MRKILIETAMIILLIFAGCTVARGFSLGGFKVLGVNDIKSQDEQLKNSIDELSKIASVQYSSELQTQEATAKTLKQTKEEYQSQLALSSENATSYITQTEKYEMEYLWTKLGNFAKQENVKIKMDLVNSQTSGLYDLNFTVTGSYIGTTDFIYDIENNSALGFKIENFKMVSNDSELSTTFTCKEISINIKTIESSETATNQTDTENTTSQTNTIESETTNTTSQTNTIESETTNTTSGLDNTSATNSTATNTQSTSNTTP